jgi:flagellar biogenesis protein FliO
MAYAWPLALRDVDAGARAFRSKRTWLRAVVPAALVCAGALLLSPPWRNAPSAASAAPPAVAPPAPLLPASGVGDPMALVGALLVVGGALALLPSILARLQARRSGGGLIDVVEVRPLGGRRSLMLVQVGARRILVGSSENGMSALAELDAAKSFADVARDELAGGGARG